MKNLFKHLAVAMMIALAAVSCDTEKLQNLQQQIDELKSNQIASTEAQIVSIKATIGKLELADTEITTYIATLQEQLATMVQEEARLSKAIADAKAELELEMTTTAADMLAQLEAYQTAVAGQIASLNTAIENLQVQDAALQEQISALRAYTDKEIKNAKDWASATFVTLEKYNETAILVAMIQGQISSINTQMETFRAWTTSLSEQLNGLKTDLQNGLTSCNAALTQTAEAITAAYTTAIANALSASEASMKSWVNEQLTGYYTAVQTDAKLAALQAEQEQKLNQQKTYVESLLTDLQTVLESEISTNRALIDNLQGQINSLSAESRDLARQILNNADSISINAARIKENAQAISQNRDDVAACETLIAANKTLLQSNTRAIAVNDSITLLLQERVVSGEQGISDNVISIAKNANDIAKNANLIAANATAISNITTAIADNTSDIVQLRADLQETMTEITNGYQTAVQMAIRNLDGKLTGELAESVTTLNTRITQEIDVVNTAITALQSRVSACENEIEDVKSSIVELRMAIEELQSKVSDLLSRIQSVKYVPTYSDGVAVMSYSQLDTILPGYAELDFRIQPESAAAQLAAVWRQVLTIDYHYAETRIAPDVKQLPISSVTADNGYLTIIMTGEGLSNGFYAGEKTVFVTLVISDGNNKLTTDYIKLRPEISVITEAATDITESSAVLRGRLSQKSNNEHPKQAFFYYSTSDKNADGIIANGARVSAVIAGDGINFSHTPLDLKYHTTYYYLACEQYDDKEYYGDVRSFTTKLPAPVDMGLSVKWASFNLGSGTIEGYGDYYLWGETESVKATGTSWYSWSNYKWYNTSTGNVTKYCTDANNGSVDNKVTLDVEDDAAANQLGGKWRMPTAGDWAELCNTENCIWAWVTQNGVNGYRVTSRITGNSIFLPAAGYGSYGGKGYSGHYWSSSLSDNDDLAWFIDFSSSHLFKNGSYRYDGMSVRPVWDIIDWSAIELSLGEVTEIGNTSAVLNGRLVVPDNAPIKDVRFYCSTTNYEIGKEDEDQGTEATRSGDNITARFTGLTRGTTYYYMATALIGTKTYYTEVKTFTTNSGSNTNGGLEGFNKGFGNWGFD